MFDEFDMVLDFDGLSLGELFAEADKIGRKYQSQEEIEEFQSCFDGAVEALEDTIAYLGLDTE